MEAAKGTIIDPDKIASFKCRKHPEENIMRICQEIGCENPICCIECIIEHEQSHKPNIKSIASFVKDTQLAEESYAGYASNSKLPSKFQTYLTTENENLAKFYSHIENQKLQANKFFDNMINEVVKILMGFKDRYAADLSSQTAIYSTNCKYFHEKITTFYKCDEADKVVQPHAISTFEEFEYYVLTKKIDRQLAEACSQSENFEIELMTTLNKYHDQLLKQLKTLPKIETSPTLIKEISTELKEKLDKSLSEKEFLKDGVDLIYCTQSFDSKIIKQEEKQLIAKWLKTALPNIEPKLIFRASKDGFDAQSFHSKCDRKGPTLVVIKSKTGQRFGGFANPEWGTVSSQYVVDKKCFLFSLDLKEKYEEKTAQHSIYSNPTYGPTFGGGHDLNLCTNCNTSNASYSNFPYSYDSKGRTGTNLAGGYNFTVEEYEVFTLTNKKKQCKESYFSVLYDLNFSFSLDTIYFIYQHFLLLTTTKMTSIGFKKLIIERH